VGCMSTILLEHGLIILELITTSRGLIYQILYRLLIVLIVSGLKEIQPLLVTYLLRLSLLNHCVRIATVAFTLTNSTGMESTTIMDINTMSSHQGTTTQPIQYF